MFDRFIPVSQPLIGPREKELVLDALDSGWVSSIGKYIDEFEAGFARYCGTEFAFTVSNGTTELHLALAALDVGPGEEVILPDLPFVATADAVAYTGAAPVLADVNSDTLSLDPGLRESRGRARRTSIRSTRLYQRGLPRRHGRLA
jgi:perosamine synthetase